MGKTQESRQETGSSAGAAYILTGLLKRYGTSQSVDFDYMCFFIYFRSKSQILNAFQKMSGVIGKKRPPRRVEVPSASVASRRARLVMLLDPGTRTENGEAGEMVPLDNLSYKHGTAYIFS